MIYLPTRVFFGAGALLKAADHILRLGTRPLLVTGRSGARRSGALEDLTVVLDRAGLAWELFEQVEENPSLETVIAGAEKLRECGCDYLIGIGGGSPIDAAKAISLAAANALGRDELYQTDKFRSSFPLAAIPTTAGTGTEVTQYSVLTNAKNGIKAGFGHDLAFPRLAVCDPRYTLSLDPIVTLNTALDALSHLLEGIYSNKRDPLLYPLIHSGAKAILDHLEPVLENPADLNGRSELMRASLYGGITIAQTSTTLQHSLGYPLTTTLGLPHGLSNAIVMRPVLYLYYPALQAELDALFAVLGLGRSEFYAWLEDLPFETSLDLSADFIEKSVIEVMASRNMANNPFEISAGQIRDIYRGLR
ncbi:MAG: iron-containing alcohol dehydrogenase [Candidatus Cloacimonetes bacterium]|nr:iron-containing alcohol dehydrogenase [Candidatus Cloacimonadota bacterium]